MITFLQIVLVWAFFRVAYWYAVRPIVKDLIQFGIFAQRDELRMLAIKQDNIANSPNYHFLEERLCASIDSIDDITIPRYLRFRLHQKSQRPSYQAEQFKKASPELKKIWSNAGFYVCMGMFVNSPIILMSTFVFILAAQVSKLMGAMGASILKAYLMGFSVALRKSEAFLDQELIPAFAKDQEIISGCPI